MIMIDRKYSIPIECGSMPIISKESLENVKKRVDLVDVLESYVDLKRSGATYKGLCPFHDEKTPSFVIQKGDAHYHCFGCGAHGDAIQFLMQHQSLGFADAVETLAQKYQVHLDYEEGNEEKGPPKNLLYEALGEASLFFHALLLHTPEGHAALQYLYRRGLTLDFIQKFRIGYSPCKAGHFTSYMKAKGFNSETLQAAGLSKEGSDNRVRDFFSDRITFPIHNPQGRVIGFSARKFHGDTFGGKYVNSPETPVFKKSQILFGLNYCRRRIAKERKVVICEGQLDCLRLIHEGLGIAVAGQGTSFGEGQTRELLRLGIQKVYLAFDSDHAGFEAMAKIGNSFQKEGVDVAILSLPPDSDPDTFVKVKGIEAFVHLMEESSDYLAFLVEFLSRKIDMSTPAGKSELINTAASQIRGWNDAVMVHESLCRLAKLTGVSTDMVLTGGHVSPNVYVRQSGRLDPYRIDPDLVLESDFLRWILLMGDRLPQIIEVAQKNLSPEGLNNSHCRQIYHLYLEAHKQGKHCDWMSLAINMSAEAQQLLQDLYQKRVNKEKAEEHFTVTVQKILDRNWLAKREELRVKIQNCTDNEDEVMKLLKEFDQCKQAPPEVMT
jgi:DNA primase